MKKYKVLIADDEKHTRDGIRLALDKKRFEVEMAEDAEKALNLFKTGNHHIVITDLRMAREDDGMRLLQDGPRREFVEWREPRRRRSSPAGRRPAERRYRRRCYGISRDRDESVESDFVRRTVRRTVASPCGTRAGPRPFRQAVRASCPCASD